MKTTFNSLLMGPIPVFRGDVECRGTDEIVCPHCGYEHADSWELADSGSTECVECAREFDFARDVVVTYTTSKPSRPAGGRS